MSNVPQLGTYVSEDTNFAIKIDSANPSNGQIDGSYKASYSPEGPFSAQGSIGTYAWVFSDSQGKDGVAPFSLRVSGSIRPNKNPYCIMDTWTGAYRADNTLLMEGSRSYVNSKGSVQTASLGTLTFKKQ
ncbi:MAG TPA: hypothetical protein VMW27_23365 [Thermoanaerobaculia bacterium]|nr:hypothetical protein [Thermoanaerobaculia bacterium]